MQLLSGAMKPPSRRAHAMLQVWRCELSCYLRLLRNAPSSSTQYLTWIGN